MGKEWLKIDGKLVGILSVFLMAGIILLSIMTLATNSISALRSYSSLQVHWTEVRKGAVGDLEKYVLTGRQSYLNAYREEVAVIQHATQIRGELLSDDTDVGAIIRLAGPFQLRDSEIHSMVRTYKRFGSLQVFEVAVENWEKSDREIARLDSLAGEIIAEITAGANPVAASNRWLDRIGEIDRRLSVLMFELSSNLEDGTQQLRGIVFWSAVIAGILFFLIGGIMARRYMVERLKSREKIQNQLEEKTTLLVEIHHRVKNNLALISGMLHLQEETVADHTFRDLLKDSQNRIASIAEVHEIMYRANNFSELSIGRYAGSIMDRICETYSTGRQRIDCQVEGEEVFLGMNQAIPIGLLLNELVTNSCKHGFEQQDQRSIRLTIRRGGNRVYLTYTDNGPGLPADFEMEDAARTSLGMQLIILLLQQLEADHTLARGTGEFRMELSFTSDTVVSGRESDPGTPEDGLKAPVPH